MKYLVILSTLFVSGSLVGWVIEVLFRRFISQKKWVNPGLLGGPYLPIYGFGVVILYAVSNIPLDISIKWVEVVVRIVIIAVGITLIEFIGGLIFIKGFKIKLWDYSNLKGNIMGIICPLFSFIWLVIGSLYYFFINPFYVETISWISENLIYTYFIGAVVGAMLVDLAYSLHLATRLKQFKELQSLRFEEFKKSFKNKIRSLKYKGDKDSK